MGHCVGGEGYDQETILSLRDQNGLPHATIQLDQKNAVVQIKGKQNKAPILNYQRYIIDFIKKNNLIVKEDGKNIGMNKYNNSFYFPDSDEWKSIYKNKIIPLQNQKFEELKKRINKNNKIDGDVDLSELYLTKLPDFLKTIGVGGNFYCSNNNLTSLEGCPSSVGGGFYCSNNNLISLKGCPSSVGGDFGCSNNKIKFTEEQVRSVCSVKGNIFV